MALMIPQPPNWQYYEHNFPSTVPTTLPFGTTVTAGASNTKGTAVSLLTVTRDVEFISVMFHGFTLSGAVTSALADILIDPAGGTSWQVLVPNLFAGSVHSNAGINLLSGTCLWVSQRRFDLPVFIPAGSSIGCQVATAHSSTISGDVLISVAGANANPGSWFCGTSVEAIGVATADSGGTSHTAGNSSAFSSWTNFGSTLSRDAKAIIFSTMGEGDNNFTPRVYFFEFGVGGERIGMPVFFATNSAEATYIATNQATNFCSLPAGTQLQVRGKSDGTAQPTDVAAWAIS